jgi:HEAT repeat protein
LGLHKDEADLEPLPLLYADVESAYQALAPRREEALAALCADWERECAEDLGERAARLLRRLAALDPAEETHAAVAHLAVTWMAAAIERSAWDEARAALDLRREVDPEGEHARQELADTLATLADERLGDAVDDAGPERQARFFGFLVGLGPPGVPLALAVLSGATHPRTRAAACTALSYLCPDEPALLAHALTDPRPALVADVVQVLGQIGGPGVAPLLAQVAHHRDPAVQREVAAALPALPLAERTGILLEMLAAPAPRLLPALLRVARLEPEPRVARALLALIEASEDQEWGEEAVFALFQALADAGSDEVVPALEAMLLRGGWFARPNARRTGAGRTLARLGGPLAVQVLEEGLRSRSAAVRTACREALDRREAA